MVGRRLLPQKSTDISDPQLKNVVRIAALASHPVMYQSQLYRLVAADPRVHLTVFFASSVGARPYRDSGFGDRIVQWDIDLLAGYDYTFLKHAHRSRAESFFDLADWDVLTQITPERYDVLWVHSYSYFTTWLAIGAARLRGIPLMIREEQTLLHKRPLWKAGIRSLTLRALFQGATGLAIGSNSRAYFRHYGIDERRLHLVPYTTDNDHWQEEAKRLNPDRAAIRASFGVRPDSPVILFVGKLQAKKQPGMLLEAFGRVRELHPCTLMLVGTGELEVELRRTVANQSIPDVVFAGFLNRTEISRAYVAADLLVLPSSLNETWGMVVNEAMNFGLPVIVSDKVGCAPDLVHGGDNGFIFDHRSAEALAESIAQLLSNPQLRQQFGRRSLDRIAEWSPELAAQGLVGAALAVAECHEIR